MKKFKELRLKACYEEVQQEDLYNAIGKSQSYLTARINGHLPFTMDDVYGICDLLHIPYEEIPKYFPRNGVSSRSRTILNNQAD